MCRAHNVIKLVKLAWLENNAQPFAHFKELEIESAQTKNLTPYILFDYQIDFLFVYLFVVIPFDVANFIKMRVLWLLFELPLLMRLYFDCYPYSFYTYNTDKYTNPNPKRCTRNKGRNDNV